MVLARLLAPEYFGILGMAMVFAGVIFVIQESGFSSYLIYKKNYNINVVSSTFWLNFIVSVCLALLLWILSPYISILYNDDQVGIVLKYVSVGILIGSFGNTSRAIIMKNNKFKTIAKVDICAELVSSAFAIYFAIYFDSLLAVSTKYLVRPLIQALLSIISQPLSINGPFKLDKGETRNIISYSSNVLGSQLFMYANNNIDYFLVGKILGNIQLGYYSLAFQWGSIARYYISNAIIRVMFPEASKLQNDLLKVKSIFLEVVSKVSLISLPLCIGFSLVSYEFIYIFYGEKWIDVVPVLQLLLLAGGIASITIVGGFILRGIGNPLAEMKTSILSFGFFGLLLIVFTKYGIIAVAYCELLRVIVVESFRLYLLKKV